ncbi:MAG: hypothetical protein AAF679_12080 [Pseudomonadota bacterium]
MKAVFGSVERVIAVLGALSACIFGYLAFIDDRVPNSGAETVELLRDIRDRIATGEITFESPEERAEAASIVGATAEAVNQIARRSGADDLPILMITDAPAQIPMEGGQEVLLPKGVHVIVGLTTYNGAPWINVNGAGFYFIPGNVADVRAHPDCHIAMIRFDPDTERAEVRPVCNPS